MKYPTLGYRREFRSLQGRALSEARRLRLSEEAVREILDRLDSGDGKAGNDRRKHRRHRYRMKSLVVEIPGPNGVERHEVPTRDLSRHGMSFLANRFVYKGTRCRVRLVSEFNVRRDVEGEVMRCRYVQGTSGVHEVGVRFDSPIDIALFHREGASSRVLLLDEDAGTRNLWTELFRRMGVEASVVESPAAAQEKLQIDHFDLVLVHADASTYSPCDFTRQLRASGYLRPIMTFSTRRSEELVEMCRSDQCTACRAVSLNRESLQQVARQLRVEPLVSSLSHDAGMSSAINAFVASLPGFLKQVETLAARKAYAELTPLLQRLGSLADTAGFEVITSLVDDLLKMIAAQPDELRWRNAMADFLIRCDAARPATLPDDESTPAAR